MDAEFIHIRIVRLGHTTEYVMPLGTYNLRVHSGGVEAIEAKNFCKECDGTGGARYYFDQDDCRCAVCPVCSGGDLKRWTELRDSFYSTRHST